MKIIIAADSFKDGATSIKVCKAIARGISNADPYIITKILPMADGGEGTAAILTHYASGKTVSADTADPLFRPVKATYGLSEDEQTAFIDMAAASGLQLLNSEERNPMNTSTYGTGLLIKDAISKGVKKILLGVGGSATNDAGIGMARALGYQFYNKKGRSVKGIGMDLPDIISIEFDTDFAHKLPEIEVLADVENPLFGDNGAAAVYAGQKGASIREVKYLDEGLRVFAKVVFAKTGKKYEENPGTGAAGGLGFGAKIFLNATLTSGVSTILTLSQFEQKLKNADFVFTGEGRIDAQTLNGKLLFGICRRAAKYKVPVVAFCGSLSASSEQLKAIGLQAAFSIINKPMDLKTALEKTEELLTETAENVVNLLK